MHLLYNFYFMCIAVYKISAQTERPFASYPTPTTTNGKISNNEVVNRIKGNDNYVYKLNAEKYDYEVFFKKSINHCFRGLCLRVFFNFFRCFRI